MILLIQFLSVVGIIDSAYLSWEHFRQGIVPCTAGAFSSCNTVLTSSYAQFYGVPLAFLGTAHYVIILLLLFLIRYKDKKYIKFWLLIQTAFGFLFSLYLVYLQLFVLNAICIYCMISALSSTLLFVFVFWHFGKERVEITALKTHFIYKILVKPALFLFDAELVHENTLWLGEKLGKTIFGKLLKSFYKTDFDNLQQNILGVSFENPVGLAAGFDYDARLTEFLPYLGFGFQTAGTVTNKSYGGNERPILGRLPKSKSLMVNKGFKSMGARKVAAKLKNCVFKTPLGVSIGRSNSLDLKTQKQSVNDIVKTFKTFEKEKVKNSFYELNISCPNLKGNINFYKKKNLSQLLTAVDKLEIKKPVFVKMPISLSNKNIFDLLEVIDKSKIAGVIFGNLMKDRKSKTLDKEEIGMFKKGNFSGKPTFERSNELIGLTYKKYKDRFVIIGCGGVFSAEDAYEKISRGAALVQLITGLVYEGPQLATQINLGLEKILKEKGFGNIKEAVGCKYN